MGNLTEVSLFIAGGSVVATLLVGLVKSFIAKKLAPKYGDLGIQVFLLLLAAVIAALAYLWQRFIPADIAAIILGIMSGANFIYQVLYKALYQKAISNQLDADGK
jgi:hypothetical protein